MCCSFVDDVRSGAVVKGQAETTDRVGNEYERVPDHWKDERKDDGAPNKGVCDAFRKFFVDRYGDYLSVQTLNQGMDGAKDWIIAGLVKLLAPKGIVLRNDAAVRRKEELPLSTSIAHGEVPAAVFVSINGLHFQADLMGGQKTGSE